MRFGAGFISDHRTASLLISLREAARKVPNCAQPIISAYGTYVSAKESLLHDLCGLCPSPRQQFSTILVETQLARRDYFANFGLLAWSQESMVAERSSMFSCSSDDRPLAEGDG